MLASALLAAPWAAGLLSFLRPAKEGPERRTGVRTRTCSLHCPLLSDPR